MKQFLSRLSLCLASAACLWGANAGAQERMPLRLPAGVVPTAYQLSLTVDPRQPRHSGEVRIAIDIQQSAQSLRLHAKNLTIDSAVLETANGQRLAAKPQQRNADLLDLNFDSAFATGAAQLRIRFSGEIDDKASQGLFRQKEGGDWYAFTQFESVGARRAFPSFDEPGWKVPWSLSLTVPADMTAVAGTPILREVAAPPRADGVEQKRVDFRTTRPLPSYLLAFGVGPFDILEAGHSGKTEIRFVTPRGRAADASYAASVTPAILQRLEAYFGQPYPFEKLDVMALPLTLNFSAMENPGLITYSMVRLMAKPGEETVGFKRSLVSVMAHELAHMWFGDMVTMAWWDDLWLNESFASWLADKISGQMGPEMRGESGVQGARAWAMQTDRLLNTSQIYQPVSDSVSAGDPLNGQNAAIVYGKGQVVLSMFETWLGEAAFQAGVRRYIARHAWGNATGEDFIAALAPDDAELRAAFRSYTQQPGIPRIAATLECSGAAAVLKLSQSRFLPKGSTAASEALWMVPVTVRTPDGNAKLMLKDKSATLALPGKACPAWVLANVNGAGYYRSVYAAGQLTQLMHKAPLSLNETLATLNDAAAQTESGDLSVAEALALAERFAGDSRREISESALNIIARMDVLVREDERKGYAALWQRAFGKQARALGLLVLPNESFEDRLRRSSWVERLADSGEDRVLRRQGLALARAWLKDRKAVPAANLGLVLRVAALDGDRTLFDALQAAVVGNANRRERNDIYAALANFRKPELAQAARQLQLAPQHDIREVLLLTRRRGTLSSGVPEMARQQDFDFLRANFAAIAARLPADMPSRFPANYAGFCSEEQAQQVERFFTPLQEKYEGMPATLKQALEAIRLCANYRATQEGSLRGALLARH